MRTSRESYSFFAMSVGWKVGHPCTYSNMDKKGVVISVLKKTSFPLLWSCWGPYCVRDDIKKPNGDSLFLPAPSFEKRDSFGACYYKAHISLGRRLPKLHLLLQKKGSLQIDPKPFFWKCGCLKLKDRQTGGGVQDRRKKGKRRRKINTFSGNQKEGPSYGREKRKRRMVKATTATVRRSRERTEAKKVEIGKGGRESLSCRLFGWRRVKNAEESNNR